MMAQVRKWVTLGILGLLVLVGALVGYSRWRHAQLHVSTENAYVRGDIFTVASKVPGTLLTVEVSENQPVRKGDGIAALDPRDFDVAIKKAQASLAEAQSGLATDQALIAQLEAQGRAAQSQLDLARTEKGRVEALLARQSIPKQKVDQAVAQEEVAGAQVAAAGKAVSAARAKLVVSGTKVDSAQAALENALLQRSYCTIVAPADGVVSKKSGEPGTVVAAGQPLCAIVPLSTEALWIEANFKETQLRNIRPGQRVWIKADVDPDRTFDGTVDSVAAGTGAAFSLLPPENATGNWVKVVQRVPVRIRINPGSDPDHKLRLGLSVGVEVDTTSR